MVKWKGSWVDGELYKSTDHYYYRKYMNNGVLKRTKVLIGSKEISKFLWKNILEKQLQTTLRACLRIKILKLKTQYTVYNNMFKRYIVFIKYEFTFSDKLLEYFNKTK